MSKPETYASVWDAIADTPEEAANLRARAELMQKIAALLKKRKWTQAKAASRCGVTQPRINDLLRGRVSRFSLDAASAVVLSDAPASRSQIQRAKPRIVPDHSHPEVGRCWPTLSGSNSATLHRTFRPIGRADQLVMLHR